MKKIFSTLIMIFLTGYVFSQSYKIDSSFGINGAKHLYISRDLNAIAIRPNNDIVVCGYNMAQTINYQMVLNALHTTGQIDVNFGNQGLATTWIDSLTEAYDCTIQPDGKIIVAGTYSSGNTASSIAVFRGYVMRFLANGSLDSSFGTNGKVLFNLGDESNFAKVKLRSNGKILLGGNMKFGGTMLYLLVQLNADGTYDMGFGANGIVTTGLSNPAGLWDMDILHDGSIIASGNEGEYDPSPNPTYDIRMCVIKYTPTGIVDVSFGTNGIVLLDFNPYFDDIIFNLHEQSDHKLIATGVGNNQGQIIRFLANGILDSTYDGDGIKTVGHVTRVSLLQQNDKLITANNYLNAGGQDIKLVRYNTDASLDTTFGINGNINHDISGTNNYIHGVTIDSMDNIIVCGSSDSGSVVARYILATTTPNSLVEVKSKGLDVLIYPNPSNDNLYLELESSKDENAVMTIVNATGQVCQTKNIRLMTGKNSWQLPTQTLTNGLYYLNIVSSFERYSTQFIKH